MIDEISNKLTDLDGIVLFWLILLYNSLPHVCKVDGIMMVKR